MRVLITLLCVGLVALVVVAGLHGQQAAPATDAAEGFGAVARGGAGGQTIAVTTLADSGPGSLRAALAAEGPRIVEFKVSGTIQLARRLEIINPYVTVAGDTAPGEGITLRGGGIHIINDCHDVILRHLRIRVLQGGASGDGVLLWGKEGGTVRNVLAEPHCSILWATDENVNTWGSARDATFQWCIIGAGLTDADHPKGAHSMGWLSGTGSDRISIHHNLFAHNADRNPKLEGGLYDLVNNVVYNWGNNNCTKIGSGARVNVVGNHYVAGPQSAPGKGTVLPDNPEMGTKVYVKGNIGPERRDDTMDEWLGVVWYERQATGWAFHNPAPDGFRSAGRFDAPPVTTHTAQQAYDLVLAQAGARMRDATDERIIADVKACRGAVGKGEP